LSKDIHEDTVIREVPPCIVPLLFSEKDCHYQLVSAAVSLQGDGFVSMRESVWKKWKELGAAKRSRDL
jgi:hypothetical protein